MVLLELSAYVPPADHVTAGVDALWQKPRGRQGKTPRPPQIDRDVEFWVSANRWRARISTARNECERKTPEGGNFPTGEWSAPMVAALFDLAALSPFPLRPIRQVLPGDPAALALRYTPRSTVLRGIDAPIQQKPRRPLLDRLRDVLDEEDD